MTKIIVVEDKKHRDRDSEVRMVEYRCWEDTCTRGWRAPYPDPKNPQYLCPHCGSHKTTFKPL
jgi:DNA-directed RNA polymerase subunit RPC12/RpoP